MLKNTLSLLLLLLMLLFLTSCSDRHYYEYTPAAEQTQSESTPSPAPNNASPLIKPTFFDLQIEFDNHPLSPFEPAHGVLLGACIQKDITTSSIRDFEEQTNTSHAIFNHTMALDEDYPLLWVLENIALNKTPLIILTPPSSDDPFDKELLTEFAINAGRFIFPMFVNLFPITIEHDFDQEEYINFFNQARNIFLTHAPNVALVWGYHFKAQAIAPMFYPGSHAIDWAHLIIYNYIDTTGAFVDFFSYIHFFNFAFQQEAPLMISTAVSHYTTENNSFFTRQAAEKISYIYSRLINYPRIKAIIYRNYNDLSNSGNKFAINTTQAMTYAYAQAIESPHFLNSITPQNDYATARFLSPFRAIMHNYNFYIPKRALIYDARFPYMQYLSGKEVIIGQDIFFTMADINRVSNADFFVNPQEGVLVLR